MDQKMHWVHTWTAMPMRTEQDNFPPETFVSTYLVISELPND